MSFVSQHTDDPPLPPLEEVDDELEAAGLLPPWPPPPLPVDKAPDVEPPELVTSTTEPQAVRQSGKRSRLARMEGNP